MPKPWEKKFWTGKSDGWDALDFTFVDEVVDGVKGIASEMSGRPERRAIRDAARTQAEAMDKATDFQREMYTQNRADMMPWIDSSKKYLGQMGTMMDEGYFNMPDVDLEGEGFKSPEAFKFNMQMDPGYQLRMDRAQEAMKSANAARGNRLSGGAMAGLMDRAGGMASDEFSNAFNRQYGMYNDKFNRDYGMYNDAYQRRGNAYNRKASELGNQYNRLSGASGMGAASQMVGLGQNYGNTMSDLFQGKGQNTANMIMAQQQSRANNPWNPSNWLTPQNLLQGGAMLMGGK